MGDVGSLAMFAIFYYEHAQGYVGVMSLFSCCSAVSLRILCIFNIITLR